MSSAILYTNVWGTGLWSFCAPFKVSALVCFCVVPLLSSFLFSLICWVRVLVFVRVPVWTPAVGFYLASSLCTMLQGHFCCVMSHMFLSFWSSVCLAVGWVICQLCCLVTVCQSLLSFSLSLYVLHSKARSCHRLATRWC